MKSIVYLPDIFVQQNFPMKTATSKKEFSRDE